MFVISDFSEKCRGGSSSFCLEGRVMVVNKCLKWRVQGFFLRTVLKFKSSILNSGYFLPVSTMGYHLHLNLGGDV